MLTMRRVMLLTNLVLCGLLLSLGSANAQFRFPVEKHYDDSNYWVAAGYLEVVDKVSPDDYSQDNFVSFVNAAGDSLNCYELTLVAFTGELAMRPTGALTSGLTWDLEDYLGGSDGRSDSESAWFIIYAADAATTEGASYKFTFPEGVKKLLLCTAGDGVLVNWIATVGK